MSLTPSSGLRRKRTEKPQHAKSSYFDEKGYGWGICHFNESATIKRTFLRARS